jgi:hypothetical protein
LDLTKFLFSIQHPVIPNPVILPLILGSRGMELLGREEMNKGGIQVRFGITITLLEKDLDQILLAS